MTKRRETPSPRVQTPEEIAAANAFAAALEAHAQARTALLASARAVAERLHPGRVHECYDGSFSVMFGAPDSHASGLAGPGLVELRVEAPQHHLAKYLSSGEPLPSPTLKFSPRAYSLGSQADLTTAETQGAALVEAGRTGRILIALTA